MLLDMVRSMMTRATFLISFWGYDLMTTTNILNLLGTKKVAKTPSEIWNRKPPSLVHLEVWGCKVFVSHEAINKLEPRLIMCFFTGYP